jgi:ABC-type transport system involved in multi-copper enzyme maturation permease subunit
MNQKSPIRTIAKYTFIEAVKNRLFILMVIGLICVFGLSLFISELAITETKEVQVALIGFIVRLFAIFIISLFVITNLVREFNDKAFEFIISLPIPRHAYFFGKLYGFILLSVLVVVIVSLPVFFYTALPQALIWSMSLICELFIMITLCLLCLFTLEHITTAFSAVVAFYILARSIGTIQLISHNPILESTEFSQQFINQLIDVIAYVIPDFGSFTKTQWLVYQTGSTEELIAITIQTVIYVVLLSSAALFDLYRKEF